MRRLLPALCGMAVALAACGDGEARVVDAWVRPSPPSADVIAAYVTVEVPGVDTLVEVASAGCDAVELHETRNADGTMQMRPLDLPLDVENGLVMAPGGIHLMCIGPQPVPTEGSSIEFLLRFAETGALRAAAVVEDR